MDSSLLLQTLASTLHINVKSISLNATFASHGGDSMAALRFSMDCRRRGVFVPVDSILSSPSITQLLQQSRLMGRTCSDCIEKGRPVLLGEDVNNHLLKRPCMRIRKDSGYNSLEESEKPQSHKSQRRAATQVLHGAAVKRRISGQDGLLFISKDVEDLGSASESVHELSDFQVSLFHGSMDSAGANIIYYAERHRPSHISRLRKAWKQVCRAEPIFGTTYRSPEDGHLMRPELHWREFKTRDWITYQNSMISATGPGLPWSDNTKDFDFGSRFTVLHYEGSSPDDSQSTIIWAVHHALIDGWSAGLLVQKVHLVASGQLAHSGSSYTDILALQNQHRLCHKAEGDVFWAQQQEKLATARDEVLVGRPVTKMDGAASFNVVGDAMHVDLIFHPDEYDLVKHAAQHCSVTPAAFLHAAWAMCLSLYTDSDNVVVGTVVSTRNLGLPGIFETIGPMVNTLPLQVDVRWNISSREFIKDVFERMQRLSHYSWTTPENGFTRVKGNLLAMTPNEQHWAAGSSIGPSFFKHVTNLPLNAIAKDDGSGILLQYSSQRYRQSDMEVLAQLFKSALMSLCETEVLLDSELVQNNCFETLSSMGNWNSPKTTVSSITEDLVTLFERAATDYPSAVAVEAGEQQITYAALDSLSGKVARALAGQIKREEVVAVHADGSINWIISIYGILRAGGTYCPLDKAHPKSYRESLFESSTARIFLATNADSMSKSCPAAAVALNVQTILDGGDPSSAGFTRRTQPRSKDRAYLCFTSGSTGKPKGVMCTHQGLVAFQSDLEVRLGAAVGTRIAQVMSVAFDGAIHELFSAISYGATLVLRGEGDAAGLGHLKTVDCAILTPSLASVLDPDDFPRLKMVYLVGEIVPQTVCDIWSAEKAVFNMYGPTEATCGATIKRLHPGQPVTIGGPNPSTRIYILDHNRQLAPPGRIGEIYLAGVQVARGYIGQPEMTKERFLADPFCGTEEFMYRTGDRGYWNEDGDIIFLGRADRQIKLHGFRVDLEDVEARILRACRQRYGVRAVAVANRLDDLVCMVQSSSTDLAGIRDTIRQALPAFAIPKHVSVAHSLPMTPNMKVDYRAVAQVADGTSSPIETAQSLGGDSILRTKTEVAVAAVWSEVLEADAKAVKIGPESNFLQLGGHSLLQLKLASRLRVVFGTHVSMRQLLTLPTLRDLAATIDNTDRRLISAPSPSPSRLPSSSLDSDGLDDSEPGPMEKEWWQKGQLKCGTSSFNVSWVAEYDGSMINQSRMMAAWDAVLARHDIFRARYLYHHEHGLRRVLVKSPPRVESRQRLNIREELNRPFDHAEEPPVRVTMTNNAIVAVWSHIICDYTALGTILREVSTAYRDGPSLLLPLRLQPCYRRRSSERLDPACLDFWSENMGAVKHARHAYLGTSTERTGYGGKSLAGLVPTSLWHRMQSRVKQSNATLQQLLIAAVAVALSADDVQLDLTIGIPYINRHSETEMEAVSLFLEPLPVRVSYGDTASSIHSYLTSVKTSSQRALAHAVPWDQLLRHLDVDASAHFPNHPLFDCVASFHDARGADSSWGKEAWGGGVEPRFVWSDGAKFRLMVECIAYNEDELLMRLEYDTACFGQGDAGNGGRIEAVRRMILTAMDAIVSRNDYVFGGLREDLRASWNAERNRGFEKEARQI